MVILIVGIATFIIFVIVSSVLYQIAMSHKWFDIYQKNDRDGV